MKQAKRQMIYGLMGQVLMVATVMSSQAGDVLRMKSGNISLQDQSKQIGARKLLSPHHQTFIVQFNHPILPADQSMLQAQGLSIVSYLPDDAYIVRGNAWVAGNLSQSLDSVRAVTDFNPEWKVSPGLFRGADHSPMVLISLFDGEKTGSDFSKKLSMISGVRFVEVRGHDVIAQADVESLTAIASLDEVSWIQDVPRLETFFFDLTSSEQVDPPAPITGYESGTKAMGFDAAWARGFSGAGQFASMSDTGCDVGDTSKLHPDLANVREGYTKGLGATGWEDMNGHGTHVSGSIVGNGKSSAGNIKGGAYSATFLPEGIWSPVLDNIGWNMDFNDLLGTVYNQGARIHSNSWGMAANFGAYDAMASRVDAFMWAHPDMLVLFAAGNSGQDLDRDGRIDENSIGSPGTAKNILTVGASENSMAQGGIQKPYGQLRDGDKKWGVEPIKSDTISNNTSGVAAFSSRGPTSDGRLKPEIVAPGTNIVSTRSHNPKAGVLWGAYDDQYVWAGGTSMATPLTAGAATVVREYLVKDRKIANPSAALVKGVLMHSAQDMYPGQYGAGPQQELPAHRPNIHEGYGRVDMDRSTNLAKTQIVDDTVGLGMNEEKKFQIQASAGAKLRATLVYTDAPGASQASKALVNDLDLSLVSPDGKSTQLGDHTNNHEMIEQQAASDGIYTVTVRASNVPQGSNGKQPFALLISAE